MGHGQCLISEQIHYYYLIHDYYLIALIYSYTYNCYQIGMFSNFLMNANDECKDWGWNKYYTDFTLFYFVIDSKNPKNK